MSFSLLVILLVIVGLVWLAVKKLSPQRMQDKFNASMGGVVEQAKKTPIPERSETLKSRTTAPSGMHEWEDGGCFQFEVVGESFYQQNIMRVVSKFAEGERRVCMATIEPDDYNKYDNKAVAVFIDRLQVGHLSRENARSFRRRLGRKGLTGQTTCAKAVIIGGGVRDNGEEKSYGVFLDMKEFNN